MSPYQRPRPPEPAVPKPKPHADPPNDRGPSSLQTNRKRRMRRNPGLQNQSCEHEHVSTYLLTHQTSPQTQGLLELPQTKGRYTPIPTYPKLTTFRDDVSKKTPRIDAASASSATYRACSNHGPSENNQCKPNSPISRHEPTNSSQRSVLLERLRQKEAIIEYFRRIIGPTMFAKLQFQSGSENAPSSGSPPSSVAHEEPLRKQVLEWLAKAESSTNYSGRAFNLDSRAFDDSSSETEDGPTGSTGFTTGTGTGATRPVGPSAAAGKRSSTSTFSKIDQLTVSSAASYGNGNGYNVHSVHSVPTSAASGSQFDQADRLDRLRSPPRVTRGSGSVAIHPVGLLARASLRGSGIGGNGGSRPSSHGEAWSESPSDIGVARHDYFVSSESIAQKESQLGLRRIEIDRGLSEEPKLLRKGLIVPDEVNKLFDIFYDQMNVRPSISMHMYDVLIIYSGRHWYP